MAYELASGAPGAVSPSTVTYDVTPGTLLSTSKQFGDLRAVVAHFNFTAIGGATTIGLGVYAVGSDAVERLIGGSNANLSAANTAFAVLVSPDVTYLAQANVVVAGVTVTNVVVPFMPTGTLRFKLFIGTASATFTYTIWGVDR